MEYQACLDYLFTQLPMYQRQGAAAYKEDLTNTLALAKLTGNPEKSLKTIHIAGTNGKGSTAHLLASVLQEQGYKTGLYTSPHLKDFRERIRIDGTMISHDDVLLFVSTFKDRWQEIQPSFFEITVAMAFWYFEKQGVDIAVIETGLGGRLDSTNIIKPELAIITNISLDHVNLLGNTIEKIALEKAGIIKKKIAVVVGEMNYEAQKVIEEVAHSKEAPIYYSKEAGDIIPETDLKGYYQLENRRTALMALKILRQNGWKIDFENVIKGFYQVQENTGLQGRWQQLGTNPLIIADCGHNVAGISQSMKQLKELEAEQIHIVIGMVGDKNIDGVLELLPKNASYYFCNANIHRALPADELQRKAADYGLNGESYSSVMKAYTAARLYAHKSDLIFVGGSVFVVGEVL